MVSPLRQVFKLTATAAEHVRCHRNLVDRQSQDQAAVDSVRQLPLFNVTVSADANVPREEVIEAQSTAKVVSACGKTVSIGVRPKQIQ